MAASIRASSARTIIGWPPRRCWCIRRRSTANVTASERDTLRSLIKQRFNLDDAASAELIEKATAAEHEAVDLYHFTRLLNRTLDDEGRAKVIEMMWQIVYADGKRDELEDNLLWRAADLLGVSPRERIDLRRRIAEKAGDTRAEP